MKKTVLTNCIKNYSEDYLRNIKKEIVTNDKNVIGKDEFVIIEKDG